MYLTKQRKIFLSVLVFSFLLQSCVSRKKIAYFQNIENTKIDYSASDKDLEIKPNDLLSIIVSAPERLAAQPFNAPVVMGTNSNSNTLNGPTRLQNYIVDKTGHINFPVLGKIKVSGLLTFELQTSLMDKISAYVKDPTVIVQITNFEVSVLGEVNRPNTFQLTDGYISLPNALGLAGDLTIFGRRDNILVIREEKEQITHAFLDLTDPKIMESPYYYLKQNDVVYVEPNKSQRQASSFNRNAGIYVSVVSVLVSLLVLFTR